MAGQITGLAEALAALDGLAARAQDQTPTWREAGELLVRGSRSRAPMATGRLRRSIRAVTGPQGLELRAEAPYAEFVGRRHPLGPTAGEIDQVQELLGEYVAGEASR